MGSDQNDTATRLNTQALAYKRQGRYSEAEPLYHQALALRRKQLGDEHPDTAAILNNLAALYEAQGKYAEAEPLYQVLSELGAQKNIKEQWTLRCCCSH